jgi:uncharacterized protein
MPRKNEPVERTCLVTRAVRPIDEMIRFVIDPTGAVVADLKRALPGRGAWVTATREAVAQAEKKRAFGRAFKAEVVTGPGFADQVDALLARQALGSLGLARKAGLVVTGFTKVEAAIGSSRPPVLAIIQAADAADDGVRKIEQALRRRFGADGLADGAVLVSRDFTARELDLAIGGAHVIHAALLAGPAAEGALERVRLLARYRQAEVAKPGRLADSELTPIAPDAGTDYEPAIACGAGDETRDEADLDDGPRGST